MWPLAPNRTPWRTGRSGATVKRCGRWSSSSWKTALIDPLGDAGGSGGWPSPRPGRRRGTSSRRLHPAGRPARPWARWRPRPGCRGPCRVGPGMPRSTRSGTWQALWQRLRIHNTPHPISAATPIRVRPSGRGHRAVPGTPLPAGRGRASSISIGPGGSADTHPQPGPHTATGAGEPSSSCTVARGRRKRTTRRCAARPRRSARPPTAAVVGVHPRTLPAPTRRRPASRLVGRTGRQTRQPRRRQPIPRPPHRGGGTTP